MALYVARPRFGFIVAAALVMVLYGVFAGSNARLIAAMGGGAEVLTATHDLPQSDFGLFWCAGKGLTERAARHLHLSEPDPAWRGICQLDILAGNARASSAWPYPPPMGFVVMPFAALPLAAGFWVWRVFSLAVGAWLLRYAGLRWVVIAAGLASPAALHDMAGGQNGTLTGAMLVAALLLAETQPRGAGVLAGLLALKPQLALAFPAIIWRRGGVALVLAGAVTLALLCLASLAVWGPEQWRWFLQVSGPDEVRNAALPLSRSFPVAGITVYFFARSLGAVPGLAWAVQIVAALAALLLTGAAWRRGQMQPVPRMALTVCLALLMMPHGFSYDLVGFSLAMAALFFCANGWEQLPLALLWLLGGYTITLANMTGLLLFPLWAIGGAGMAWRLKK